MKRLFVFQTIFIVLLLFSNILSVAEAKSGIGDVGIPTLHVGDFADYRIAAGFYEWENGSIEFPPGGPNSGVFEGSLRWDITGHGSSWMGVLLTLSLDTISRNCSVIAYNNGTWTYANGTSIGYVPLWISDPTVGSIISVSGQGDCSANVTLLSGGLQQAMGGWQDTIRTELVQPYPRVWNGSLTLMPWYFFDLDTGLLIKMSANDPIWQIFGAFSAGGTIEIVSTSLDLGPRNIYGDVVYFLAMGGFPLVVLLVITAAFAAFILGLVLLWFLSEQRKIRR